MANPHQPAHATQLNSWFESRRRCRCVLVISDRATSNFSAH